MSALLAKISPSFFGFNMNFIGIKSSVSFFKNSWDFFSLSENERKAREYT